MYLYCVDCCSCSDSVAFCICASVCINKCTSSKNLSAICGCFVLSTARVKALGWLKKKEEKEDDETRFSSLPGSSL